MYITNCYTIITYVHNYLHTDVILRSVGLISILRTYNDHMNKLTDFIKLRKLVHDYVCTYICNITLSLIITRQMLVASRNEPEVQQLNNACMLTV